MGLAVGLSVASGGPLMRWSSPKPRRVLYVDGEMPLSDLQVRLASLLAGLGTEIPNDGFRILAADSTECGIDLSAADGQRALEPFLKGVDLLILDNLSTLMSSGSEGASDAWLPMQNWLLALRRRGISVLLIHHAGVNGRQRGTSRREDALDTVIALRRPPDYSAEQGARFEVHLEKTRTMAGQGALPFETAVESFVTETGASGVRWVTRDLQAPVLCRAAALFEVGMSVREVEATESYLTDEDAIGRFIAERCDRHEQAQEELKNLYAVWKKFSEASGEAPLSEKSFSQKLEGQKFVKTKHPRSRRVCFRGIRLRPQDDEPISWVEADLPSNHGH